MSGSTASLPKRTGKVSSESCALSAAWYSKSVIVAAPACAVSILRMLYVR